MKKLLIIIGLAMLGLLAVSCYDDSALWNSMEEYENRLASLESKYETLNGEISSLKTLVSAFQQGDYITSVSPIKENGKEIGYEITFATHGTISILHGQDAVPATTPMIGIKKDTDGVYYWTIDGEWLLDEAGQKVKAVGTDGKDGSAGSQGAQGNPGAPGPDGITPKLKIENEYWYVSYDDGKTWTPLNCKATGEDGAPGVAESLFKAVYQKDGYLVVELADGNVFNIPVSANGGQLDIHLDAEPGLAVVPGATVNIRYSIKGADENTMVRVISNVEPVLAIVKPENSSEGYICLYVEEWFDETEEDFRDEVFDEELFGPDVTENDFYHSLFSIIVTVVDGKGNQVMKVLNIDEGTISSVLDAYVADAAACSVTAQVKTNVDYEVVIPQKDTWLTCSPSTKAQMRTDEITFSVAANTGDMFRGSNVSLVTNAGQFLESLVILQRSPLAGEKMAFADKVVERACVSAFDTNLDGAITYEEAAKVTDLNKMRMPMNAVSFDELKHFVGITTIPSRFFAGCQNLRSVVLPEQITSIGRDAFTECRSLESVIIPQGVVTMGYVNDGEANDYNLEGLFCGCYSLASIEIPDGVKEIETYRMFGDCWNLASVKLPAVTELGDVMFKGCEKLTSFEIPESVTRLGEAVFAYTGFTSFVIPERFTELPHGIFSDCPNLSEVILHDKITYIGPSAFSGCRNLRNIDLPASLEVIGDRAFAWSGIRGKEVEIGGQIVEALQIPESVVDIQYEAFIECQDLKAVQMISKTPCYANRWSFPEHTMIYVPDGCYDAYRNSWGYDFNWAEKSVYVRGNFAEGEHYMIRQEDGTYHARVTVEAYNEFYFYDDTGREYFYLNETSDPVVYEGVNYTVGLRNGGWFVVPVSGIIDLYLSNDMSQFHYIVSSVLDESVVYFDNFDWLAEYAMMSGASDSVGEQNPSGNAPNMYTSSLVAGAWDQFIARGYKYLGATVGDTEFVEDYPTKCIYVQMNYLKLGKTKYNAAIKLPALQRLSGTSDVRIEFDWCWHLTGANRPDLMTLSLDASIGTFECSGTSTSAEVESSQSTVEGESYMEWQHVVLTLNGATAETVLTIRPTHADPTISNPSRSQNRWHLDNIMVTKL